MIKYKIIEDYLPENVLKEMYKVYTSPSFPWYYSPSITSTKLPKIQESFYFYHTFYEKYGFSSNFAHTLDYLMREKLKPISLINVRLNLTVNRHKVYTSNWHQDEHFDKKKIHTTSILYLNSNNGETQLRDDDKIIRIKSVANRLLTFNSAVFHRIKLQTNTNLRLVLNLNYYD
tara:strand:+ start:36 stop:557 length:522 start_codon:yes stop_codon:yes gene_type:complete